MTNIETNNYRHKKASIFLRSNDLMRLSVLRFPSFPNDIAEQELQRSQQTAFTTWYLQVIISEQA